MMLAVHDEAGRAIAHFSPLYDDDPASCLPDEPDLGSRLGAGVRGRLGRRARIPDSGVRGQ